MVRQRNRRFRSGQGLYDSFDAPRSEKSYIDLISLKKPAKSVFGFFRIEESNLRIFLKKRALRFRKQLVSHEATDTSLSASKWVK